MNNYTYALSLSIAGYPTLLRTEKFPNPISVRDSITISIWKNNEPRGGTETIRVSKIIHEAGQDSVIVLKPEKGLNWQEIAESGFSFRAS